MPETPSAPKKRTQQEQKDSEKDAKAPALQKRLDKTEKFSLDLLYKPSKRAEEIKKAREIGEKLWDKVTGLEADLRNYMQRKEANYKVVQDAQFRIYDLKQALRQIGQHMFQNEEGTENLLSRLKEIEAVYEITRATIPEDQGPSYVTREGIMWVGPKSEQKEKQYPISKGPYVRGINPVDGKPEDFRGNQEELKQLEQQLPSMEPMPDAVVKRLEQTAEEAISHVMKPGKKATSKGGKLLKQLGIKTAFAKLHINRSHLPQVNARGVVEIAEYLAKNTESDREWHAAMRFAIGTLLDMHKNNELNFNDDYLAFQDELVNRTGARILKGAPNNIVHTFAFLFSDARNTLQGGLPAIQAKEKEDTRRVRFSNPLNKFLGPEEFYLLRMPYNKPDEKAFLASAEVMKTLEEEGKDRRFAAVKLIRETFLKEVAS